MYQAKRLRDKKRQYVMWYDASCESSLTMGHCARANLKKRTDEEKAGPIQKEGEGKTDMLSSTNITMAVTQN